MPGALGCSSGQEVPQARGHIESDDTAGINRTWRLIWGEEGKMSPVALSFWLILYLQPK